MGNSHSEPPSPTDDQPMKDQKNWRRSKSTETECTDSSLSLRISSSRTSSSSTPSYKKSASRNKKTGPLSRRDCQMIVDSWALMNSDKQHTVQVLGKAWLRAAENCPEWIWGLIGVNEFEQDNAFEQPAFTQLIQTIRGFLDRMVVDYELDVDRCRREAVKLGSRHTVYFPEGFQQAYWDAFTRALHDAVTQLITTPAPVKQQSDDEQVSRTSALKTIKRQHKVAEAWHTLLRVILTDMKKGYTGEYSVDERHNELINNGLHELHELTDDTASPPSTSFGSRLTLEEQPDQCPFYVNNSDKQQPPPRKASGRL